MAFIVGVVAVKDDEVFVVVAYHGVVTQPVPVVISCQDDGSSTLAHRHSCFVEIGSLDVLRSADHDAIVAFLAAAAIVEGYEEVKVAILFEDEGRLDGGIAGGAVGGIGIAGSGGDGIPSFRLCEVEAIGCELYKLDTVPKRTEGQPGGSLI